MNLAQTKSCFYEAKKWYAITIAPDDNLQWFLRPERCRKSFNLFNERLLNYSKLDIEYCLWQELSEPIVGKRIAGTRIHYHGIIRFRSERGLRAWLTLKFNELTRNCIIDIDTIDDMDIWIKYCTKMQHIVKTPKLDNLPEALIKEFVGDAKEELETEPNGYELNDSEGVVSTFFPSSEAEL